MYASDIYKFQNCANSYFFCSAWQLNKFILAIWVLGNVLNNILLIKGLYKICSTCNANYEINKLIC